MTPQLRSQVDELLRLAGKATPGPWESFRRGTFGIKSPTEEVVSPAWCDGACGRNDENAAYIAAANPLAITQLLTALVGEVERQTELANLSVQRLCEMSEPGWIGAFGARDAAKARAEAAEQRLAQMEAQDGWVSVNERLPQELVDVLVWWPDAFPDEQADEIRAIPAQYGFAGWRSNPDVFGTVADSGRGNEAPTYWRPLPDPPKESNETA